MPFKNNPQNNSPYHNSHFRNMLCTSLLIILLTTQTAKSFNLSKEYQNQAKPNEIVKPLKVIRLTNSINKSKAIFSEKVNESKDSFPNDKNIEVDVNIQHIPASKTEEQSDKLDNVGNKPIRVAEKKNEPMQMSYSNDQPHKGSSKKDKTMKANEIREESRNSLLNCSGIKVKEEYADCVIDNLSLEFFFTAFVYYQKRFKKNYGSVREENRRFQIFMKNYRMILK